MLQRLLEAARNGDSTAVKDLVAAGADVHCKDNDGYGRDGASLGSLRVPRLPTVLGAALHRRLAT